MDCPSCHAKNVVESATCAACGGSLRPSAPRRRSGSRRRNAEGSESADDSNNPTAWRAYRVALWSIVPGLGLLLGPLAMLLGWRAVRTVGDDRSARNRAKAAVLFGSGSALSQWLGVALMYYC